MSQLSPFSMVLSITSHLQKLKLFLTRKSEEDDNNNNPELFLFFLFLPSFPSQEHWGGCPAMIRSSLMQQIFPILRVLFCHEMRIRWMDTLGGCQGFIPVYSPLKGLRHSHCMAFRFQSKSLFQKSGGHLGNGVQANSLTFSWQSHTSARKWVSSQKVHLKKSTLHCCSLSSQKWQAVIQPLRTTRQ